MDKKKKIKCPYCGYELPIFYADNAVCKKIYAICKGRNCKKIFEIKVK
jgi:hypothetical protein|nr:MAG TPA: Ogr/Delta-like zinc finger protein [Caudoviricetes sp.]